MPRRQGRSRNYTKKRRYHRHHGKKKQTRKNRFNISTPFDAVAEIRAQETHNKHMEQMKISTNPFGRTANKKYGIDTASITGKEILKIADRLQRKRDRRRRSGKPELMHEERELKKQQKANFLKEIEKLRPPHWNKKAWDDELEEVMNTKMITPRSNRGITHSTMVRDLTPITEVNITEEKEDDVPVMNLSKVFARRKFIKKKRDDKGEGNKTKRKKKKKKKQTKKRKRRNKKRGKK